MSGTVLGTECTSCVIFKSVLTTAYEIDTIIHILKMKKIKYREVKSITQDLTARVPSGAGI